MSSISAEDVNTLIQLRNKRLKELAHLQKDPLVQNLGKFDPELTGFAQSHSDPTSKLKCPTNDLDKLIDDALYTESNKRPNPESFTPVKKSRKLDLIPSIKQSVEEDNGALLNQQIENLDILSVPQHYPVGPHNVSSLAELYYLTQTLPLIKLLPGSHKTLMTDNFELALLEGKIAVLYSRIEELKRQGKWSLRQPIPYVNPLTKKKKGHWDHLLKESHWMATDFKEQTKYKKACCLAIAQSVSDYWTYGKDAVCIKTRPIEFLQDVDDMEVEEPVKEEREDAKNGEVDEESGAEVNKESGEEVSKETGEASAEPGTEPTEAVTEVTVPTTVSEPPKEPTADPDAIDVKLLLLKPTEIDKTPTLQIPAKVEDKSSIFKVHVDLNDLKKVDQSVIRNLPKFTAFDDEENTHVGSEPLHPDSSKAVPVSKLLYPFEEDDGFFKVVVRERQKEQEPYALPSFQKGLFGTQAHRRFNYLKPPKPPLIKNIEYRSPTIWLPQDDKYLIHYVAEFCFNWELISEHLLSTVASMKKYESNIERRTPWQCFERYIQLNEKFQFSDMKGQYSYQAQQWLEQAHRAQSTTKRRISPLGIGNDSIQRGHRRLRWASMFDAMRKSMRKREAQIAKMNSRRATEGTNNNNTTTTASTSPKPNSSPVSTTNGNNSTGTGSSSGSAPGGSNSVKNDKIPTPAELSKLKFERDQSIQEAYLNQQATRNRMMAAVAQQQKQQQQQQTQKPGTANSSGSSSSSSSSAPKQQQPGVSPTNATGRSGNVPPINRSTPGIEGLPTNPNGQPYTPEQLQKLIQIQKQRRMMQNRAQYQQRVGQNPGNPIPSQQNSPDALNMMANQPQLSPQGQSAQLNKPSNPMMGTRAPPVNSKMSPNMGKPANPQHVQPSGSNGNKPRIQFAPAQVSAIINSIQQKNPNLSKEQVTKLAASYLANLQQQQQQKLQQRQQQQQQQQQQMQRGQPVPQSHPQQGRSMNKQPQVADLTPQERNQLQMLKAAKTQQQQQQMQQLQQQQMRQMGGQMNGPQRSNSGSPLMNPNNSPKLDYEQRKRMLIQKQQLQQQQYRQRMGQSSPQSDHENPN